MPWDGIREQLRARGLRWTPQRRALIEVLLQSDGHVTGAELVDRCRAADPTTVPSTVYRTLDVLEELGVVRHAHGVDGREEFHVFPVTDHGHLYCTNCHGAWEVGPDEAGPLLERDRAGARLPGAALAPVDRRAVPRVRGVIRRLTWRA